MHSSEMPQGVEHGLSGRVGQKANVSVNSYEMPPGVEHRKELDGHYGPIQRIPMRCRKALSTGPLGLWIVRAGMANSYEMPPGVEHSQIRLLSMLTPCAFI